MSDDGLAELLTLTVSINGGETVYRNHLGQKHRVHGPAVIFPTGSTMWYMHGKRHRTDGPAYVSSFGFDEWWLDGEEVTEGEWNERIRSL